MDQQKTGAFLKKLRKEKDLTQEQLAEQFCISRRTVSRWETGNNLPDIDILIEMADFYEVDLRELLDGERRSEQMNNEVKETVLKAAEYDNGKNLRNAKLVAAFFIVGILGVIVNQILLHMNMEHTFWTGLVRGISAGIPIGAMIFGLSYISGYISDLKKEKERILNR
ncbi:MAG: helix-turn-helix domain-containing protein [Lachnospiraceae bacterium]